VGLSVFQWGSNPHNPPPIFTLRLLDICMPSAIMHVFRMLQAGEFATWTLLIMFRLFGHVTQAYSLLYCQLFGPIHRPTSCSLRDLCDIDLLAYCLLAVTRHGEVKQYARSSNEPEYFAASRMHHQSNAPTAMHTMHYYNVQSLHLAATDRPRLQVIDDTSRAPAPAA